MELLKKSAQKCVQTDAIALRDSVKEQDAEEEADDCCRDYADCLLISMIRRDRENEMLSHLEKIEKDITDEKVPHEFTEQGLRNLLERATYFQIEND